MLKKFKIIFLSILTLLLSSCSNNLNNINTIEDLNNKNIGIYTGSEYDTIAKEKIKNANLLYYNNYNDQISALKSGKIDAFLTDEPLANEIIKNSKNLKILEEKLTDDSYAFAISPSQIELQQKIDNILNNMQESGILKEFEKKWMGDNEKIKQVEKYNYNPKNGTIKFATVSGSAPFAYIKNNEIVGYDIEVINYISKELGYKLEIIEMSFDGIIPALISNKVDIAGCSIIVTEERKKSVLFSKANYTGGIVIVARES